MMAPVTRRKVPVLVRAAAAQPKKADQADKSARQNGKRRVYHKSKKSEIFARMKKVFVTLDGQKKSTDHATKEDFEPIETLIAEAFSIIEGSEGLYSSPEQGRASEVSLI